MGYKQSFEKQPSEKLYTGWDFAADLEDDETIANVDVTAIDLSTGDPASVLDGAAQIQTGDQADSEVVQRVEMGTDGGRYKLSFKITTSDDNNYEADTIINVRDL